MIADLCLHPGGLDFTAQLIQTVHLSFGANVLDAGCGAGLTVQWLTEQGFNAWGIDRNPLLKTAQIRQGMLQQLPYKNESFAAVVSECTAFICGNTRQMLEECQRILEPKGWLLLSDVFFAETGTLPSFSDGRPVTLLQWRQLLQQSGFIVRNVKDVSEAWKPFVLEQLWAGKTLDDLWGGCLETAQISAGSYRPQYFLLWAQKGAENNGGTAGFYDAYVGINGSGV